MRMTMQAEDERLGRICYEGYSEQAGGRSLVTGDELVPWEGLGDALKTCWIAAAQTVAIDVKARQIE
jgi:hypothetical protein